MDIQITMHIYIYLFIYWNAKIYNVVKIIQAEAQIHQRKTT